MTVLLMLVAIAVCIIIGDTASATLKDGQCERVVIIPQYKAGTVPSLSMFPFYKTQNTLNSFPTYTQTSELSFKRTLVFSNNMRWEILSSSGGTLMVHGNPSQDPTVAGSFWNYLLGSDQTLTEEDIFVTTCSKCSLSMDLMCKEMNMICNDANGDASCICDTSYGLRMDNDTNECVSDMAFSITIDSLSNSLAADRGTYNAIVPSSGFISEWVNDAGRLLSFTLPGIWSLTNDGGGRGIVFNPSIYPASLSTFHLFDGVKYAIETISVSQQFCNALAECGENFLCERPTPSFSTRCVCDLAKFQAINMQGNCENIICDEIFISGFIKRKEAAGVYRPIDGVILNEFSVYAHALKPERTMYFANNRWHIGDYQKSTFILYGPAGARNPLLIDSWVEVLGSEQTEAHPVVTCYSCSTANCPANLQCIKDTKDPSNFDNYDCACAPHTMYTLEPEPMCIPSSQTHHACELVQMVVEANQGLPFFGLYVLKEYDDYHYPIYQKDSGMPLILFYDLFSQSWRINDDDGSPLLWCAASSELAFNLTTIDCEWELSNYDESVTVFTSNVFECVECTNPSLTCDMNNNQRCVQNQCVCTNNTFGPSCTPIDDLCSSVELTFPAMPFFNGAYYYFAISDGRPAYRSVLSKELGDPIFIVYISSQWRLSSIRYQFARLTLDSLTPINSMTETKWEIYITNSNYISFNDATSTCSECKEDLCYKSQVCKTNNASIVCSCLGGFDDTMGMCTRQDVCNVVFYANQRAVGYFTVNSTIEADVGGRFTYSGYSSLTPSGELLPHIFHFVDDRVGWFLTAQGDTDGSSSVTFSGMDVLPQAISGTINVPTVSQLKFGESIATFSFVCDMCEDDTCNPTMSCLTKLSGDTKCVCDDMRGLMEFKINGQIYCQVENFSSAPHLLAVLSNGDVSLRYELVFDNHINGWHYYRIEQTILPQRKRREDNSKLIFYLPDAYAGAGGWAIGNPSSYQLALSPGPPHKVLYPNGVMVVEVCDYLPFSAFTSEANSIMLEFQKVAPSSSYVVIATHSSFDVSQNYSIPSNVTSFTISSLRADQSYFIRAAIVKDGCYIHPINQKQVDLPVAPPNYPPPNIMITDVTSSSISLSVGLLSDLDSNGVITGYSVEYEVMGDIASQRRPLFASSQFTLNDLHPAFTYLIRIAARNSAGNGPFSEALAVVTSEDVPDKPSLSSLTINSMGDVIATVDLPNVNERNGELTQVRFICIDEVTRTQIFSVVRNVVSNNTYTVGRVSGSEGAQLSCVAAVRTSAGFGDNSFSTMALDRNSPSSGSKSNGGAIVAVVVVFVVLLLLLLGFFGIRKFREKNNIDIFKEGHPFKNAAFSKHYEIFKDMYMFADQLKFVENLGEGQFGSVVLAESNELPNQKLPTMTKVAVKYLKQSNFFDEQDLFMDEAARMQPLNHSHVVRLLAVSDPACPEKFIVLEHLAGGDLIHHLREVRPSTLSLGLSRDIQFNYCRQVCSGLAYLGSVGYVHRDLAARNILMSSAHALKIGDFGMARSIHSSEYYSSSQAKARLPLRWMSSEAVLTNKYTHLSDVYSFGVVMYEIFTYGDAPWAGYDDQAVIFELRQGHNMPIENVPEAVQHYIIECWQPENERPSAAEMEDLLNTNGKIKPRLNSINIVTNPMYVPKNEQYPDADGSVVPEGIHTTNDVSHA
eukprot:m.109555 g.109555  ORF g.109555 m.109555 type:complete len:1674 (-) comp9202_c0_seq1:1310-6331(-)